MKLFRLLPLLLFGLPSVLHAQFGTEIDSMITRLDQPMDDTQHVELLLTICDYLQIKEPQEADTFLREAQILSEKIEYVVGITYSSFLESRDLAYFQSDSDSAIAVLDRALAYLEKNKKR